MKLPLLVRCFPVVSKLTRLGFLLQMGEDKTNIEPKKLTKVIQINRKVAKDFQKSLRGLIVYLGKTLLV